jgi:hypothetical protein
MPGRMISYDLRCTDGHIFEAWFKDRRTYLDQQKEGLVLCPICNSSEVDIAFTSVAVKTDRPREALPRGNSFLKELSKYLEKNFEDVGNRFAEEARRIHYEEAEKRNIRGVTTPDEEKDLKDEGVEFFKVPLPKLDS